MFLLAPITDTTGKIIALFSLRIDPTIGFSNVFRAANIGKSGEVYAVNKSGQLLTRSRFETQLIEKKQVTDSLTSILNITMSKKIIDHTLPEIQKNQFCP